MPAAYTHKRFGEAVRGALPRDAFFEPYAQEAAFYLGLHGPDPLFYYHPLRENVVSAVGYRLHEARAADFFVAARDIWRKRGRLAADTAFLYGFICHFALDSACHAEVAAQMRATGLSHTEVESGFDRILLEEDGFDPLYADPAAHLTAEAGAVSAFAAYCGLSERTAERAVRAMKRLNRLLRAPYKAKRAMIDTILRITKNYDAMHGMMIPAVLTDAHKRAAQALIPLFRAAHDKAKRLIQNYRAFLDGDAPLDRAFYSNYESEVLL